jgi:hypothetical protein
MISSFDTTNIKWFDLFSRGLKDWSRHNQKIKEQITLGIPEIVNGTVSKDQKFQLPIKMLQHYRFKLLNPDEETGVGQGDTKSGDKLKPADQQGQQGQGGSGQGEISFAIEMSLDEVVDWLWEELKLPDLKKTSGNVSEQEWVKEGIDKKGARSRLDRRRTLKEAIKRRSISDDQPAIINEDLRFRQIRQKPVPDSKAVCVFGLDVSGSMTDTHRILAKSFFFWMLQGIRRTYKNVEVVFLAHTDEAWQFEEEQFFQVSATGGTSASSCFKLANSILQEQYIPKGYSCYFFYASDGDNMDYDNDGALNELNIMKNNAELIGYTEINPWLQDNENIIRTEMSILFSRLSKLDSKYQYKIINRTEKIFDAIKHLLDKQESSKQ